MANTLPGFVDTLTQGITEASAALVGTTAAIDSVYKKYETRPGGGVMQIPRPSFSAFAEAGAGDNVYTDVNSNAVTLLFNKRPAGGFLIRDLEQYQTPADIREAFLDAALKNGLEYLNAQIMALFNEANDAANFPSHGASGNDIDASAGIITVSQFLGARTILGQEKAAIDDPESMSLLVPDHVYHKMMDSSTAAGSAWTAATSTGDSYATSVRTTGRFPVAYGTKIRRDQQVSYTSTPPTRVWNCLYLHKAAIGLGLRPLPKPDGRVVDWGYIDVKGVPMRWMVGYDQDKAGYKVSIDYGYALGVVRENLAVVLKVTEA